jgi:hypothetical protein
MRIPRFRLLEAMDDAGLSNLSELSRRSGVSRPTIYSLLNNSSGQVYLRTLGRLALALDLESPGDLIVWAEE